MKVSQEEMLSILNKFIDDKREKKNIETLATLFGIKYAYIIKKNNIDVKQLVEESAFYNKEKALASLYHGMESSKDIIGENMEDFNTINDAWFVGATGTNEKGEWTDFSDIYIQERRWENRYNDKYVKTVQSMQVGDKIAIKSSYTKKNVPFATNGEIVSVMGIKAVGTIIENLGDGKNVKVIWEKVYEPKKEWFFYTMRNTIWHVERKEDDWIPGALLDFTFCDKEQDYEKFLNVQYWKEKYCYQDDKDLIQEDEEMLDDKEIKSKIIERLPRTSKLHTFNQILYGAPGTGKTYITAEYAIAILENRKVDLSPKTPEERAALMLKYRRKVKEGKIVFTTFHQSYGYEDFIQGLRPETNNGSMVFTAVNGVFKNLAEKAMLDTEENYVLIIDEINRGNISKIFGELITLIEDDKRWGELNQLDICLPSGEEFAVPNNLYIVGTMNSADKSIALIDTALRRRFKFIEVAPNPDLITDTVLKSVLEKLNEILRKQLDSSDLLIGHAYFINKTADDLVDILNGNIIPLLYEYFYDNAGKVKDTISKVIDGILGIKLANNLYGRIKVEKNA